MATLDSITGDATLGGCGGSGDVRRGGIMDVAHLLSAQCTGTSGCHRPRRAKRTTSWRRRRSPSVKASACSGPSMCHRCAARRRCGRCGEAQAVSQLGRTVWGLSTPAAARRHENFADTRHPRVGHGIAAHLPKALMKDSR